MSKFIGEVAAIEVPKELLTATENFRGNWVNVLASAGSVELICDPVNLHPTQARYLATLLQRAADEAEMLAKIGS